MSKSFKEIEYVANLFEQAILDMAISTGSISKRLSIAYNSFLYKTFDSDDLEENIPKELEPAYLYIKQELHDNIIPSLEQIAKYWRNAERSDESIRKSLSRMDLISAIHWRKSKKISEYIKYIYVVLSSYSDEIKNSRFNKTKPSFI